jgi:prepilin-type processing-associated H-X9-DG protein
MMHCGSLRSIRRAAYGLVEVLVTIGLVGTLIGLLLPALNQARSSAARIECMNNLRQIGIALHAYHDLHSCFPPASPKNYTSPNNDANTILSWMALILPQMGEEGLWATSAQACLEDGDPTDNPPHVGYSTVLRSYVCPGDRPRLLEPHSNAGIEPDAVTPAAFTSYLGMAGVYGMKSPLSITPLPGPLGQAAGIRLTDITDGTSRTLLVGERPPPATLQAGRWYPGAAYSFYLDGPNETIGFPSVPGPDWECVNIAISSFGPGRVDNPCDRYHLWSWHPGGANFLFCDGSVSFLPYSAAPLIAPLSTIAGGEQVVSSD